MPEDGAVSPVPSETVDAGSKRKVADRPSWWTVASLLVSVAALLVSLSSAVSAWRSQQETEKNRKINEATSRAYVKVSSALIDTRQFYNQQNSKFRQAIA